MCSCSYLILFFLTPAVSTGGRFRLVGKWSPSLRCVALLTVLESPLIFARGGRRSVALVERYASADWSLSVALEELVQVGLLHQPHPALSTASGYETGGEAVFLSRAQLMERRARNSVQVEDVAGAKIDGNREVTRLAAALDGECCRAHFAPPTGA
jgi:hypothetical protein